MKNYVNTPELSVKEDWIQQPLWNQGGISQGYAELTTFDKAGAYVDPTTLEAQQFGLSRIAMAQIVPGGVYEFGSGTVSNPGIRWAADTDTGLYWIAAGRMGVTINGVLEAEFNSSGILLPNLTETRVVFAGFGGQLTDDAGLSYVAASDRLTVSGQLRVGTPTDTLTAGDFVAGLAGASRFIFDQSDQSASIHDSGGAQDILLKCNGNSWYNGTGQFGFGTTSPAAKVDIVSGGNGDDQLRLGNDTSNYCNWEFDGNLTLTVTLAVPQAVEFNFQGSSAGDEYIFFVRQLDNTDSNSDARLYMQVGGTSGGSPYITWDILGGANWFAAVDNADSDKFKIGSRIFSTPDFTITTGGYTTFSPAAASSGTAHAVQVTGAINTGGTNGLFRVLGAASTGQTASTEIKLIDLDLGATVTWATGAIANQRCVFIEAPTLAFAGASVVTNAATVYIDRAPQAGLNATISAAYALWVDDGITRLDGSVLLASLTSGRVTFAGTGGLLTDDDGLTFDGVTLTLSDSNATTTPLAILNQASTGDSALRWTLGTAASFIAGIDNSDSDKWKLSYAASGTAVLGTGDYLSVFTTGATTVAQWFTVGTATEAATQGDLAAGLSGSARFFFDQSANRTNLISGSAADLELFFNQGANGQVQIRMNRSAGTTSDWYIYLPVGSADLRLFSGGDRVSVTSGGFVGIGTTGPDRRLDILDASNPQLRLTHTDGSVYADLQTNSSGHLVVSPSGNQFRVDKAASGAGLYNLLFNSSDTGGSEAIVYIASGGASGGSPYVLWDIFGVTQWTMGPHNSDSDSLVISESSTLGTNNRFRIDVGGKALFGGELEIDGALNHDGSTVGFYGVTPVVRSSAYSITNVTTDRAYDANSTTLDEIADTLGTLIADLKLTGIIA